MLKIKLLLATMSNEPLGDIDDEGEPPLSPSMTTTNRDKPYLPSDTDMPLPMMITKNYKIVTMFYRLLPLLLLIAQIPINKK